MYTTGVIIKKPTGGNFTPPPVKIRYKERKITKKDFSKLSIKVDQFVIVILNMKELIFSTGRMSIIVHVICTPETNELI